MSDAEYLATYGDRSLDVQVAERLMGWTMLKPVGSAPMGYARADRPQDGEPGAGGVMSFVPHYASDYRDAWRVWRECVARFGHVEITADMEDYGRGPGDIVTVLMGIETGLSWRATGPFPSTICKLALEADEAMAKYEAGVQP